ncbi:BsuPI-related putative proteinase inhibitor [Alkalicoccus chagannorensis]|uniref:BsuPI-related putative proteinase inhibitor n=1 Tax=Alkalicoccus chagannorensis TaxID=427072 RepID=UPI0003FC08FE|nr:BsuPI-related putative proteinase inhibitor [Alkalicoccus chagannorensis]
MRAAPMLILLFVMSACSRADEAPEAYVTVDVQEAEEALVVMVTLENIGEDPIRLDFRDGQMLDFHIVNAGQEVIYSYGDDRMFTQALETVLLQPGETKEFREEAGVSVEEAAEIQVSIPAETTEGVEAEALRTTKELTF